MPTVIAIERLERVPGFIMVGFDDEAMAPFLSPLFGCRPGLVPGSNLKFANLGPGTSPARQFEDFLYGW
jgi:hypothetical protein